jgi:hypothetical protein
VNPFLSIAAGLILLAGVLHSVLGERLIVRRLSAQGLPDVMGSAEFTKRVLRLFWHAIGIAWWGLAAVLLVLASLPSLDGTAERIATIIALTFLASSVYAFLQSRGRHFSWAVFLAIAVITWIGIR